MGDSSAYDGTLRPLALKTQCTKCLLSPIRLEWNNLEKILFRHSLCNTSELPLRVLLLRSNVP